MKQVMTAELIENTAYYELRGADSIRFLNNYCTADLKTWDQTKPVEAMMLDVKGRLIALTTVFAIENGLGILCWGTPVVDLAEHLDRYIFGNDKSIQKVDARLYFVPHQEEVAFNEEAELPRLAMIESVKQMDTGCQKLVTPLPGDFYLIAASVEPDRRGQWLGTELQSQISPVFHRLRIGSGYPMIQQDTVEATLVQELGRDDIAISFTKGCYLGQETVARLDARGHVNWQLARVVLENPLPEGIVIDSRMEIKLDLNEGDSIVGHLTSVSDNWALARIRSATMKRKNTELTVNQAGQYVTKARLV